MTMENFLKFKFELKKWTTLLKEGLLLTGFIKKVQEKIFLNHKNYQNNKNSKLPGVKKTDGLSEALV